MSGQCFEHLEEAHNAKQSFLFHILISKYIQAAKIQSGVCQQCWCKSLAPHKYALSCEIKTFFLSISGNKRRALKHSKGKQKMGKEVIGTNWTELTCPLNFSQRADEGKYFLRNCCYQVSHKISHEAYQQAVTNHMPSLMPIIHCTWFLQDVFHLKIQC